MRILIATSEAVPFAKTGGLADVGYALPHAQKKQGADVRILLPAYREVLNKLDDLLEKILKEGEGLVVK